MGTFASRRRRALSCMAVAVAAAPVLAACGSSSSKGPATISFYDQPGSYAATQANADYCTKHSGGKYKVKYIKEPTAADQQRLQLVRRMAAHDSSVDIMGLDVTWEPEFAEAGWLVPWSGTKYEQQAKADQLAGPLKTATWKGKLVALPYNSNTQLLWYRKDLAPNPPKTWDQMIAMAESLAKKGKPHYVEEQGAQYEGVTVWFASLVNSAGGSILNSSNTKAELGQPGLKALQIMHKLATSAAGDPSLSTNQEDQGRLAMEGGSAAFEINYPYVWPSMQTDKPSFYKSFAYAPFPTVAAGQTAHPTIGGIDLAISPYSKHRDLAFQAALCLASKPNQMVGAIQGGLPPTLQSAYTQPTAAFKKAYPFYKLVYQQLKNAGIRPQTPAYQSVSIAISHSVSPPAKINPPSTLKSLKSQINDALQSKGLVP